MSSEIFNKSNHTIVNIVLMLICYNYVNFLIKENVMVSNLQRGIVATNSGRWGDNIFKAPEQELKDQLIQHGVTRVHLGEVLNHDPFDGHYWCHRKCESDYTKWYEGLDKSMCKARCNRQYQAPEKSQSSEYPSQASDIKSTLENIGDSFYTLADSFSVL